MHHSPPDPLIPNQGRPVIRYLVVASVLHLLVLGVPLHLQTLSAETPAHPYLHATLQPLNSAKPAQALPVPKQIAPAEKKPKKTTPLTKPAKEIISSRPDIPGTPPTHTSVEHIATPSAQDSTVSPSSNPRATKAVPPRFDAAYLNNPRPNYPPISRRQSESGKVLLKVRVNEDGQAVTVDIAQSSHSRRLDEAARQAVSQWRFIPAKLGEQAISADVIVPIIFKLDD